LSPKAKSFLVSLLIFVVFPGFGLAIGINIGKNMAYSMREGYGASWKILNSSIKFKKIVEATSKSVWAQASDGKLYYYPFRCYEDSECNQWIETQVVPDDIHFGESPVVKGISCPYADKFKYLKSPPGNMIECVQSFSYGMDIVPGWIVYYALIDDGNIWAWSYSDSMLDSLLYNGLGSCSGLLLGIVASNIFILLRKRRRQIKTESQEREMLS
jgi:hypothetical protein